MAAFQKRISTIEKAYLVFNALRPPFCNQFVVAGRGTLDEVALKAAIDRAALANPGARLVARGRLGRMRWVAGPEPRLTVVRGACWDGRSEAAAPFLDRPLDPVGGPSCEVQYVETSGATFLVFRSLHATMDGLGTRLWAEEVFRALRDEAPLGYPCRLTDSEFAAGINPARPELPEKDALHPCGAADGPSSDNQFAWTRLTIDAPAEVHTVGALAVVLAREARRHGAGPVRLNIPADLRFFRPEERSIGNVIGTLLYEVPEDATAEQVAGDLKRRLKARHHARLPPGYQALRWLPLPVLRAMMRRAFADEHAEGRYHMSATLSFLGAVDPAAYVAGAFAAETAFWIPPMADQACFVTCNRFGTHLELCLALPRVLASRGRLDQLSAALAGALTAEPAQARARG